MKNPGSPERISRHILPTAGTMVGVCTTLVGLVKIAEDHIGPSRVDEFAALCGIVFLASAICSYLSFRGGFLADYETHLERAADVLFLLGLVAVSAISGLFAYELI